MRWFPPVFLILLFLLPCRAAPVAGFPFSESTYVNGGSALAFSTGMAWAPDDSQRLFISRKGGLVRIVQSGTLLSSTFASITPIYTTSECGLIGLCFDPNYLVNRYVYFFVTVSGSEQQIVRYTDDNNTGVDKTVIVSGLPTLGANHDGGSVNIGPDGKLYFSIGDGGSGQGVDANLTTLFAKVGRADRFSGAACIDNPFHDGAGPNNDYIWARGHRNPFTALFHPTNRKLWVSTVGTNHEQVFAVSRGDHSGWNDYENTQPDGFLAPVITYVTNGTAVRTIRAADGAVRSNSLVTITTTGSPPQHRLRAGMPAVISGVADASFSGTFFVQTVLSGTQFTYVQTGPDAISGSGTCSTVNFGGCVTGGFFYDSTAFPPEYHGNFFVGDYNPDKIHRATFNGAGGVDTFSNVITNVAGQVDITTGPDGALYYIGTNTSTPVYRLAHTGTDQNVVVWRRWFDVVEGGTSAFTVRMAKAPVRPTRVVISKLSGDAEVQLVGSGTLTFTGSTFATPQAVYVTAAHDADVDNDGAVFQVKSVGLPSTTITINAIDDDESELVVGPVDVELSESGTASFQVRLANAPVADVSVLVGRTSGDGDLTVLSGSTLTFTPANFSTWQNVTLAAAEDGDQAEDTAVFSVQMTGQPSRAVRAKAADNDPAAPAFSSSPSLTGVIGAAYQYQAVASGNPLPALTLTTAPVGMSVDSATGNLSWAPTASGTFDVAIKAQNGLAPAAQQSFSIVVLADQAPSASITTPTDGAVVSGSSANFSGNGADDVGTTKAEFFVDDVLVSTVEGDQSEYHFGGQAGQWDTTSLTSGSHTIRMRVTDSVGQTGETERDVLIGNGADAWKAEHFTAGELADEEISGDGADADFDLLANLLEYGTGTPPRSGQSSRHPVSEQVEVGGQQYLAVRFVRAKWATDLTWSVLAGGAPGSLTTVLDPDDPEYQVALFDDEPAFGLQTVVVRDAVSMGIGSRFLRVRAER